MPDDFARPITVYVSRFQFEDISMEHLERKRISVIDVEMSYQDAEVLRKFLKQRLDKPMHGAVRIRIYGNLVIS
jgi:hypothetical protein